MSDCERIREVTPTSPLVARMWLLANGAHDVELYDTSDAGWLAYCHECQARSSAAASARHAASVAAFNAKASV